MKPVAAPQLANGFASTEGDPGFGPDRSGCRDRLQRSTLSPLECRQSEQLPSGRHSTERRQVERRQADFGMTRLIRSVVGLLAALVIVTGCLDSSPGATKSTQGQDASGSSPGATETSSVSELSQGSPTTAPAVESTTPPPPETAAPTTATPAPVPAGVAVESITDGDTIRVAGGVKVRLIGIDTPERGQCGYSGAAMHLASLIRGRNVVLVPGARDDADKYGRLLRYVEVEGVDLNLEMIRSGRAIARYDSRDGYGRHARQDDYIAADAASPSTNFCAQAPATTAAPGPAPAPLASPTPAAPAAGGGTDPRFGTCKEAKANGFGPYVQGVNPEYGWYRDGDRDGTVCE